MREIDLSIIIVHTFEKDQIRQTLRGIKRAAPKLHYEVILVDNNIQSEMKQVLKEEFPSARYLSARGNLGFGGAMNIGIRAARGKYILIFNPDIVVRPNSLETLFDFMEKNPQVGIVGPKLLNPDGSLQYSCFRFPTIMIPVYRRTFLGRMPFGKKALAHYLMQDDDHNEIMEVDSLIGAALFTRREALNQVGLFDERFFMYYEDNDLCRRFWEKGYKVVYNPQAQMIHYHRRASADGNFWQQLMSKYTRIQIMSAIKFFLKYRHSADPRRQTTTTMNDDV
ncbi:glycosyltransferase family 2 protein [Candidatus Parcubacteria bacterium]|nr:MAG: glycosyltransferase family 2 protein [Candidatus Parcubacteria bacterium]